LTENGYDATTIRAIAKRLDCAVGSIYRYFSDKHTLVRHCGQQMIQPVLDGLETGDVTLGMSKRQYIAAARTNEELYRLMFWLVEGERRLPEVVRQVIEHWSKLADSDEAAQLHWATVHATVLLGHEVNLQSAARPTAESATNPAPGHESAIANASAEPTTDTAAAQAALARRAARGEDVTLL
jgi:AcrR family transcriptional regulator